LAGSTTARAAAMAKAASTALPPFFRISTPAWEAMGWEEAQRPLRA